MVLKLEAFTNCAEHDHGPKSYYLHCPCWSCSLCAGYLNIGLKEDWLSFKEEKGNTRQKPSFWVWKCVPSSQNALLGIALIRVTHSTHKFNLILQIHQLPISSFWAGECMCHELQIDWSHVSIPNVDWYLHAPLKDLFRFYLMNGLLFEHFFSLQLLEPNEMIEVILWGKITTHPRIFDRYICYQF